jgi:two-component system response regulator RegX3
VPTPAGPPSSSTKPDFVLLDLRLPDIDGHEACRQLRQRSNVPIIMLTGRTSEADRVAGLRLGADDYISKPFSFRELLARIRAVTRRAGGPAPHRRFEQAPWNSTHGHGARACTDASSNSLQRNSTCSHSSPITRARSSADDGSLPRSGKRPGSDALRMIDIYLFAIRRKLGNPDWVETVRGKGLRFRPVE